MIKEGKFGVQEAVCLITITITTRVFFTSPGLLADILGTATWYMTLISGATATLAFTFVYLVLKKYPGKNLVEAFETVWGRFVGSVFSFLLASMMMYSGGITLREFTEVTEIYVLPLSPSTFVMGIFILGVVIVTYLGLEALARYARLAGVTLLVSFLLVLVLSWQNYDIHHMFPLLGYGLGRTVFHGIARSTVYADTIMLGVIAGSLQGIKHIKKAGYISIALSTLLASSALLAFTLAFPYYVASEITAPMYHLTSIIDYGRFFQRLEPIFIFVWNTGTFISVTANFYIAISIYCKIFRIQDIRPVILPFAAILFSIAMIPRDFSELTMGYIHRIRELGWTVFYIPPILTLVVAWIRKKKGAATHA